MLEDCAHQSLRRNHTNAVRGGGARIGQVDALQRVRILALFL